MNTSATPNAAERQRWNDAGWTASWLHREPITASVSGVLLEHLDVQDGERLLDIGCGAGGISLVAAPRLAPGGAVTGVDLSERLVAVATARAADAGLTNATFVVADAQTDTIGGAPFDGATSQFGVMFFDDPKAAFANVAGHVVSGGRFTFACWQRLEDNPWCVTPVLAPFLAPQPTPPLGGPFGMADRDHVVALLDQSGWEPVGWTPYERTVVVRRDALIRDDDNGLAGVAEADRPAAVAAMEHRVAPFLTPEGNYEIPIAFQLFTARRSR